MPHRIDLKPSLFVALLFVLAGGCVQEKKVVGPGGVTRSVDTKSGIQVPQGNPNVGSGEFTIGDPCSSRLHDIEGQLIEYYYTYRRMPDRLEELKEFASFEQVPNYTCPISGQPYAYNPAGLQAQGQTYRMYVYDPVAHDGRRNVIVMRLPVAGQPLVSDAPTISEAQFRLYSPPSAPPPTSQP
jgi:hypothetical protein